MRTILLLALFATFSLAYDPVFVEELEDIVFNVRDRMELHMLEEDDFMTRSVKKEKLDAILARQPQNIKQLYEMEVERKKEHHRVEMQLRRDAAMDPQIKEYWKRVEEIENDMSISENEADMREKALELNLTPYQRRIIDD